MTRKVQKVAVGEEVIFYLGEPARLSSRRFQASQTHIHGSTLRNVVSSRRAVGLSATMFFGIRHRTGVSHTPMQTPYLRAYRIRPPAKKHFRFNPSRMPVRDIFPFRGEPSNPFARTFFTRRELRVRTFSQKMVTSPASGYRHATADAVGRGFSSSGLAGRKFRQAGHHYAFSLAKWVSCTPWIFEMMR